MICCSNFNTLPKFHIEFLLLEARNSLEGWPKLLQAFTTYFTITTTLLPYVCFFHHTLLPHHKKLLSCYLFGATRLLQALPPWELAQEARAPRSFSIKTNYYNQVSHLEQKYEANTLFF